MRWERLFGELENALSDDTKLEHEFLASELRDEEWAATSWTDLLGGTVQLTVRGHGALSVEVEVLADGVLATAHHLIRWVAVESFTPGQRAGSPAPTRYSWRSLVRALVENEGPRVRVTTLSGAQVAGDLTVVGGDHLRVGTAIVPWEQVAMLTADAW